jgi:tetratricopeptide (TPR) repeat protein
MLAWDFLIAFLAHQERLDEVESLLRERFESRRRELTEVHPFTRLALAILARYLWGKGDVEESLECYRQWAGWVSDDFQKVDLQAMEAVNLLAARLKDSGRSDEGVALLRKFLETGLAHVEAPDASPSVCMACARLLIDAAFEEIRNEKAALELAKRAVELSGEEDAHALETLAMAYHATDAIHEAVETMKAATAAVPTSNPEWKQPLETKLIRYLYHAGRAEEAEEMIHEIIEKDAGRDGPFMPARLIPILLVLIEQGRFAVAEPLARRCLEICTRFECHERWEKGDAQCILGAVLAGLGRFKEAESLLLEGYRDLSRKPHAFEEAARALEWIVELYEKWGKPDEAAAWRARR